MSKLMYRYVEVTDGERFRGVLPADPLTMNDAETEARIDAARAWNIPVDDVEVFVLRTVTPEKAGWLRERMNAGTLDPDWWIAR